MVRVQLKRFCSTEGGKFVCLSSRSPLPSQHWPTAGFGRLCMCYGFLHGSSCLKANFVAMHLRGFCGKALNRTCSCPSGRAQGRVPGVRDALGSGLWPDCEGAFCRLAPRLDELDAFDDDIGVAVCSLCDGMMAMPPVLNGMADAAALKLNGRTSKLLYYGASPQPVVVEELACFELCAEVEIAMRGKHLGIQIGPESAVLRSKAPLAKSRARFRHIDSMPRSARAAHTHNLGCERPEFDRPDCGAACERIYR